MPHPLAGARVDELWELLSPDRDQWRPALRVAISAAGPVLAYVLVTRAAAGDPVPVAVAAVLLLACALLASPVACLAAALLLDATVLERQLLGFSIGPIRTDVGEVLIWGLIAAGAALPAAVGVRASAGSRTTARLVLLYSGTALLGALHGLYSGVPRERVQGVLKEYLILLLVVPLLRLCSDPVARERLANLVVAVCTGGSLYIVVAQLTGLPVASDAPTPLNTLGIEPGIDRVRPLLLSLLVLGTLLVQLRVHERGWSAMRSAQLCLFIAVWALSFNRTSWLPLLLCSLVLALLRGRRREGYRGLRSVVVGAVVVPAAFVLASQGALGSTAAAVTGRISSVANPQLVQENSYTDRERETRQALDAIETSPVLGVGMANTYGYSLPYYDYQRGIQSFQQRDFVHNSLLMAYLHLGLLGVLALLALGWQIARLAAGAVRAGTAEAGRVVAAALALLALGLSALAEPYLYYRPTLLTAAIALVLCHDSRADAA